MRIQFLGGTETVTGSKFLIHNTDTKSTRRLRHVSRLKSSSFIELGQV